MQTETFFTITIGNVLTILGGIFSIVVVYLKMNNQVVITATNRANDKSEIDDLKKELMRLEAKTEMDIKNLSKSDADLTLALQENTLAVRELRRYMERVEDKIK